MELASYKNVLSASKLFSRIDDDNEVRQLFTCPVVPDPMGGCLHLVVKSQHLPTHILLPLWLRITRWIANLQIISRVYADL